MKTPFKKILGLILGTGLMLQFSSCSKTVTMTRLVPAAVSVSPEIQKIVIVDRTKPQNEVVSVIEGLITGELPFEVRNSIEATLSSLQQTLNTSPRFEVVRANQRLTGGMFGQIFPNPLDWYTVERLCEEYQADAVLVLENFSADFVTTDQEKLIKKTVGEGNNERTVEVKGIYLEGVADVSAGFRLYDPFQKSIIDQQRFQKTNTWSAEAETKTQALALLIAKADATRIVGELAGAGYATKIAPMYVDINRGFYPKSKTHPAVAEGARLAEVDQWEQAIQTWESALPNADEKTGGMLLFNIAVGYEVLGSLDLAKEWAGRAYTEYGLKKARNYVRTLDQEIQNANLLNQQIQSN
ncbi:DUF6340 family protein [Algoriphagus hitonicola]|uniref:Uncharacterized protein n=1 Tax=Algoriphagus hitonicola TaxID=435880 RepID=A0A1I2VEM1_9BACT|nr:DUF6340 family protein [Algoriphagus hitonicola]SFG85876.1 hypothetical protein SAMN04487988_10982 [Algoriphagus hitonicola]